MKNLKFNRVGEMVGICNNAKSIEILHYNVDGKGGFLYNGDGKLSIATQDEFRLLLSLKKTFTWNNREFKIDNILDDTEDSI